MSRVSDIQNFIIIACRSFLHRYDKGMKIFNHRNYLSGASFICIGLMSVLISCMGGSSGKINETPTSGDIKIYVDESFQPLLDTEIRTFTGLYRYAKIKPVYKPEVDVINDFMNDSVKVIATSRRLTDDQIKYLRDTLIIARTTTFAYDAIALITNKQNRDSLLKYETVNDIFLGKITKWNEVKPNSGLENISVIFDNTNLAISGISRKNSG